MYLLVNTRKNLRDFEKEGGGYFAAVFHCCRAEVTAGPEYRGIMLLGTDAPWLHPRSRGRRNDSSCLKTFVDTIAAYKSRATRVVVEATTISFRTEFPGLTAAGAESGGLF